VPYDNFQAINDAVSVSAMPRNLGTVTDMTNSTIAPTSRDLVRARATMRSLAVGAAVSMRAHVGSVATTKSDGTPVTLLDVELNELVAKRVLCDFPDAGLLGEEGSFNVDAAQLFIVDPIDGTAAFTAGLGVASFVMAYTEDGTTRAAIVEDPFTSTRFEAALGHGATINSSPLTIPSQTRSSIVIFEALRDSDVDELRLFAGLRAAGANPVRYLSFASVAARVATGAIAGAIFARPSLWDCLAVSLIAREAGAVATTFSGQNVTGTDLDEGIIIAHPAWHTALLDVVARSQKGLLSS
jgi:fructose-1,6-bisphosphatase/inositol monophosphatase family enzyme